MLRNRIEESLIPLLIGLCSGLVVFVAVEFSNEAMDVCKNHPDHTSRVDVWSSMAAWDGQWQIAILRHGYQSRINAQELNPAAFPPLYPALASILYRCGIREEVALLVVSNLAFLLALVVFYHYLRDREFAMETAGLGVLLLALFPFGYFFRMAYTESLFVCLVACSLWGLQRKWHPAVVALLVAGATATRVVGIVLVPILFFVMGSRYPQPGGWFRGAIAALAGLSGLLGFMVLLHFSQGDPLAVFKAQAGWTMRGDQGGIGTLIDSLLGVPLVDAYNPSCLCYWQFTEPSQMPLLNMRFWNPIIFFMALVLTIVGWRRRWLSPTEVAYCALVLVIPYLTQGYRICMASQARYALAAFPLTIVVLHILQRLPAWSIGLLTSVMAAFLFANAALFTAWYFNY